MKPEEILMAASTKSDSAEVYSTRRETLSVSFENNRIKDSSSSDLSGTAVRVKKDGRLGFSTTSRPDDVKVADRAVDLSQFGKIVGFDFASAPKVKPFPMDRVPLDALNEEMTLNQCEKAVSEIRTLGNDVLAFSGITKNVSSSRILSTNGADVSQEYATIAWYAGLLHNTEGNFIQVYDYKTGKQFEGFGAILKEVLEDYRLCATNVKVPTGKYRVLFSPRGLAHLLMVFSACLSGKAVSKGISPWSDKLGAKLFDERFSLLTDLVSEDSPIRTAVDSEGIPTGRCTLIGNGELTSFYHSLDSAAECGQTPTGHGFRPGSASQPAASMSCVRFAPGNGNLDLMKEQSQIWVDELIGAVMSNPYAGIISGNVSMGFTVNGGVRQARLKDVMLSLDVFDIFKSGILDISSDVRQIGDSILPYMLLDGVTLSS